MGITPFAALMALVAATPASEAEQLGRVLAEQGTLAALLPLMKAAQIEELVAENPTLTSAEKATLRGVAEQTFVVGRAKILAATGHAYALRLSVPDLRALVAFHSSAAAKRQQAAAPEVIAAAMKAVGPIDFKADTRKAFCARTGKLCGPK